jgi:hypothetical protein
MNIQNWQNPDAYPTENNILQVYKYVKNTSYKYQCCYYYMCCAATARVDPKHDFSLFEE